MAVARSVGDQPGTYPREQDVIEAAPEPETKGIK